jgi:hypothetical protein
MNGTDHLRMRQLSQTFEQDGFVNGGLVLEPDELAEVQAELERFADIQIRGQPGEGPMPLFEEVRYPGKLYKMSMMRACSPVFRRLTENKRLMEMAAELLQARTLQVWADIMHYKLPLGGGAFAWHQDGHYHMVRACDRIVTAWIALDDADEESGCMWMVPGSHRWGDREEYLRESFNHLQEREEIFDLRPPPDVDGSHWSKPVPCPVKPGEVHFHHAYAWHASPTNTSARLRRGYTIFYVADGIEPVTEQRPIVFDRSGSEGPKSAVHGRLATAAGRFMNGMKRFSPRSRSHS